MASLRTALILALCFVKHGDSFWFWGGGSTPKPGQADPCKVATNHTINCPFANITSIPLTLPVDLQYLHLSRNYIREVPELPYKQLKQLDLSQNSITVLKKDVFQQLKNLQILDLAANDINIMESGCFYGLTELTDLYLNGNRLKYIENDVFYAYLWPTLRVLDLSFNQLEQLDSNAFTDLNGIMSLRLRSNRIKAVNKNHFLGLDHLEYLELTENEIEIIQNDTFTDCDMLQVLDISYNRITTIEEHAFRNLDQLNTVSLSNNNIMKFHPKTFINLPRIHNIHLEYNPMPELQGGLFPPTTEKVTLTNMPHLEVIRNGSFTGLHKLNRIVIDSNRKLHTIESGAFSPDHEILYVDLSSNALTTLSRSLLNWTSVDELDLSGNPWYCDCTIEWMKEASMNYEERDQIRCTGPGELSGKSINEISPKKFICVDKMYRRGLALGLITLLVLMISTGMGFLIYRYRNKVCGRRTTEYKGGYRAFFNMHDEDVMDPVMSVVHEEKFLINQNAKEPLPPPTAV